MSQPESDGSNEATSKEHASPFRQVAQRIAEQISAGELSPGTRIPAERKLAEEYAISRMTARAAVEHLAQQGLVERKDRSGTYVAQPKVRLDLSVAAGLSDQFRGVGIVPGAKLIVARTLPGGSVAKEVSNALDLREDDLIHELRRQRTGNGESLVLEESYFPASRFPGLLDHDLTGYSIYHLLQEEYGQSLHRFRQELELVQLDAERAQVLETRPDVMSFRVTRTVWNSEGAAVEFARDFYRADRVVFTTAATK
ncbi:MAG TPA: GntR family transcriptional regulator [Trueperaceae bacterium]